MIGFAIKRNIYGLGLLLLVILIACDSGEIKKYPDTSDIQADVNIIRFDKALRDIDTSQVTDDIQKLIGAYPIMSDLYFSQIVGIPIDRAEEVYSFLQDTRIRFLLDTVESMYPDLERVAVDFEKAFKNAKYYFPDKKTPDVYTVISEYGIGNFLFTDKEGQDALGVGLDFYLGSSFPYRQAVPNNTSFSDYLTRSFNEDHMVRNSLMPWIEDWVGRAEGNRLVDLMLHEGIKRYVLERLIPFASDTVLHKFTSRQMDFCYNHEVALWAFFLDDNVLYSVEPHTIRKYVEPSPRSAGMPESAPGQIAIYLGYRIISAYMARHGDVTLKELIHKKDYQDILEESRYNPR